MPLTDLQAYVPLPDPLLVPVTAASYGFNGATLKFAEIVQAPKDGTINEVHLYTTTVTTGATLDARIETVDLATGNPSGSLVAAGASGSKVFTSGDNGTWAVFTLSTPLTVTAGDQFAIVFEVSSGTPNITFLAAAGTAYGLKSHIPYRLTYNGSAWTKATITDFIIACEYNGDTDPTRFPFTCPVRRNSQGIASNLSPDTIANRFRLPYGCQFRGWWFATSGNGAADMTLRLEEDGGSVLASFAYDAHVRANTSATGSIWAPDPVTLDANTYYRVVAEATSTTNDPFFIATDYARGAVPELDDWQAQKQTDAGAWSTLVDTNCVAALGIWIDQIDMPASAYAFGSA